MKKVLKASIALLTIALMALATIPTETEATTPNSTIVDESEVIITDEGWIFKGDRSDAYHHLYITEYERDVIFINIASFTDSRTDGIQRVLEISISAEDQEEGSYTKVLWIRAYYTPPFL